jgi:hypothetical protein
MIIHQDYDSGHTWVTPCCDKLGSAYQKSNFVSFSFSHFQMLQFFSLLENSNPKFLSKFIFLAKCVGGRDGQQQQQQRSLLNFRNKN